VPRFHTLNAMIHVFLCIAGMEYLHQRDFIHRDLKTANGTLVGDISAFDFSSQASMHYQADK